MTCEYQVNIRLLVTFCYSYIDWQTATSIADTTTWTGPRTLDHLADFIIKSAPRNVTLHPYDHTSLTLIQATPSLSKRLSQRSKSNSSPTLLFITGAALRAAEATRVLKDKRLRGEKGGEVAKLFAKHFKLAEHVAYLAHTKVGAAVGTPGRIGKLLCETGASQV